MPDGAATLTLTLHAAIEEIDADAWDACAGRDNPFVSHAFLSAMEDSGSANARTGWLPQHAALRAEDGRLVAVAPMYAKSHSYGEYVFDHGWANALDRAGGSYYPKLQVAAPFSPVPGPRLLRRPECGIPIAAMANALQQACKSHDLSSVHVTFLPEAEAALLGAHGFLRRTDQQFHWENAGYATFDDFLAALASRKRKAIRRERETALASGVSVHWLTGPDLTEEAWDAFFTFYMETGSRKWGRPYLTRDFYTRIGDTMPDRIALIMAKRDGRWIAGAINFIGGDTLFGRHWGAIEHHPFLHFEVCYYQAIDYAIRHGLKTVEAGAQGEHKIARGYLPQTTYSAHYIVDTGFRHAVRDYLKRERQYVAEAARELTDAGPFRKTEAGDTP